jgi:hypothetical protein
VRTFPPEASQGWTISFIERESRYWLEASAGLKEAQLFEQGVQRAWHWAQPSAWIRWFTDGERRYGKELWKLASVYLPSHFTSDAYPYRKVWREGLYEIRMNHHTIGSCWSTLCRNVSKSHRICR